MADEIPVLGLKFKNANDNGILKVDDDGDLAFEGNKLCGDGGSGNITSEYKYFDGDGSTKEFDCEIDISVILVSVDGFCIARDFSKDGTKIVFDEAPGDGKEIDVQIFKSDNLSEEYKLFTGDGTTTDFDCEIDISLMNVSVEGFKISPRDFTKDGTKISFDEAPADGDEIDVWIIKQ